MRNALDEQTSPYLLQHKDNPVHWQAWGEAAFALAREQNKPILLSVGYAACHWCHVMAHESFEEDAIAGLMNELFVNIKVDREERPDVDAIYQAALALIGQHGGWPLTMFLTPDGEPFWGGTYFPSTAKYGRAAFPDILRRVSQVFHEEPDSVAKNKTALTEALQRLGKPPEDAQAFALNSNVLDQVAQRIRQEVDATFGGIGQAPKFPQPYAFETLWRAWLRTRNPDFRQAVEHSLTQMCQGGIYDHLGGGFARYSTDERWLAPHFEKMLYDNAQLLDLLTLVWQETGAPLYRIRAEETVGWLEREMLAEGGAFAASLDADSEGEEGRFYVWQEAEIDAVLGADAELFKQVYDVTGSGNWEHRNILNRSHNLALADDATEAILAKARDKLLAVRAERVRPGWDDKVLADWNGLMIAALANASLAFDRPHWLVLAKTAFATVIDLMSDGDRLCHAYRDGRRQAAAMLDDYANMARAAVTLHELTGKTAYLERARAWVAVLDRHYLDGTNGGYFYSADDASDLIVRLRHCQDNAVPAGNATIAAVLVRLWLLTGDDGYRARADTVLQAFAPELLRNFFPMTSYVNALELMLKPVQVVITGERGKPDTEALIKAVAGSSLPDRILQVVGSADSLPDGHPATGKGPVDGKAAAYVCIGPTCSLPATTPAALSETLAAGN